MNFQTTVDNPATRRAFLGGAATLAAYATLPRGALGADDWRCRRQHAWDW